MNYIELTDAEAASIVARLTSLAMLSFDYEEMMLDGFITMLEDLTTSVTNLRISGNQLGVWYATATQQQKDDLAAVLARFTSLETLFIEDTSITAVALDAILEGLPSTTLSELTVTKGKLAGFTGVSLAGFTALEMLILEENDLTEAEFISLVSNLGATPITDLDLSRNGFDDGDNYIDLAKFDFSGVLDTLSILEFSPYFSCNDPWIEDYTAHTPVPFDLATITINPEPEAEPENCVEPVEVEEEEHQWAPDQPEPDRANILRIEPAVTSVTLRAGDFAILSTEAYGLQDRRDDSLADLVGPDEVRFEWDEPVRRNRFSESPINEIRRNTLPDDREVMYQAPDRPGRFRVAANILPWFRLPWTKAK